MNEVKFKKAQRVYSEAVNEVHAINMAVMRADNCEKYSRIRQLTYIRKYFERMKSVAFESGAADEVTTFVSISEMFNNTCILISRSHAKALAMPEPGPLP